MSKRLLAALAEVAAPADDLAELNVTPFSELKPIPRYLTPSQVEFAREFNKRLVVDTAKYEEYADLWRAGVDLAARDPMVVFYIIEQQRYVVIDCWHRLQGWILANGDKPLQFAVVEGTEAQAHAAALGANPGHGIPRSNDDKVKVVKEALERYTRPSGRLSDQLVARICGVSAAMVGKWRARLEAAAVIPSTDNVTTGNGRTMQTASIGNKPAPAPGSTFVASGTATNGAQHSTEATVARWMSESNYVDTIMAYLFSKASDPTTQLDYLYMTIGKEDQLLPFVLKGYKFDPQMVAYKEAFAIVQQRLKAATNGADSTPVATATNPVATKAGGKVKLDEPFNIGSTSFLLIMGGELVSICNEDSADGAEVVIPLDHLREFLKKLG